MSAPRVSVVVPAHNAAAFVGETLASVRAQTFTDVELIVVDDGSHDETARRVRETAPGALLMEGPRRGVSQARNAGVRAARGDYVALLDHDDLWEPDKTRRQVDALESDPSAGLVFTQARVVRDGREQEVFPLIADPASFLARAHAELVHWNFIPMSSVMVRREVLAGLPGGGPFDARFILSEDWDLWLRLAAAPGCGMLFIAEPLTRYRHVAGRATERMADLRLEDLTIFEEQLAAHPSLEASEPARCRETRRRLHDEAGYWLLKEGRRAEARRHLVRAWSLRPAALRPLARLAASMLAR